MLASSSNPTLRPPAPCSTTAATAVIPPARDYGHYRWTYPAPPPFLCLLFPGRSPPLQSLSPFVASSVSSQATYLTLRRWSSYPSLAAQIPDVVSSANPTFLRSPTPVYLATTFPFSSPWFSSFSSSSDAAPSPTLATGPFPFQAFLRRPQLLPPRCQRPQPPPAFLSPQSPILIRPSPSLALQPTFLILNPRNPSVASRRLPELSVVCPSVGVLPSCPTLSRAIGSPISLSDAVAFFLVTVDPWARILAPGSPSHYPRKV